MQAKLEDSQRQANELQTEKDALAAQRAADHEALVKSAQDLSERVCDPNTRPAKHSHLLHRQRLFLSICTDGDKLQA